MRRLSQVSLAQAKVVLQDSREAAALFGRHDENLRAIERDLGVKLVARGDLISISGHADQVAKAEKLFAELLALLRAGNALTLQEVRYAASLVEEGKESELSGVFSDVVQVTARGKPIKPKTLGQRLYVQAIRDNDLVFGIGPAGTGKTYLAVAMAVAALKDKSVNRIILTRPALEAGEKLGFLPGDLQEKVDPYLRPLYDALYDIIGMETFQRYMDRGMIEVAPLAYMRGRTLDDSFVILDEAQNTTPEQMKMFLTRLGFGSRAVVTGDITQIDLPHGQFSGLEQARVILAGISGIEFVYLTDRDVVRHELVTKIIRAYERYEVAHGADGGPRVDDPGRDKNAGV